MSFLIDTDICSAYIRGDGKVFNKFLQHSGGIHLSIITVAELQTWAYKQPPRPKIQQAVADFIASAQILLIDEALAETFGKSRAALIESGINVPFADMMIAATALRHDLTLATHNVKHYTHISNLRVEDWTK